MDACPRELDFLPMRTVLPKRLLAICAVPARRPSMARAKGGRGLARILSSPPKPHTPRPRVGIEELPMISCPACGFDESRLAKSLRLGCSTCYTTFAPHIATFLPRLHRGVTHTGKQPPVPTIAELDRRIDRLVEKVQALAPDSPEAKGLNQLQSSCRAAFDQIQRQTHSA